MKAKGYLISALIFLAILGVFLTIGIVNSRRTMMQLLEEEARGFLSLVSLTQENSIFAEANFEDQLVEKLINICHYLESTPRTSKQLTDIREAFDIYSITIKDSKTNRVIKSSGNKLNVDMVTLPSESVSYTYFSIGPSKYIHFIYKARSATYELEVSAQDIQSFRQEFGINKIMDHISANPLVKYLVLQDMKGIIFATPNVQTISRIEDDDFLKNISAEKSEASRVLDFEDTSVLELVRPFEVEGKMVGLFRIGLSLESYRRHMRSTERQLILLFVVLLGAGFVLLFMFVKYQSYLGLKEVFHKTLSAIEDAVLTVDKNGVITGVNEALCVITAYEEKVLVGHKYEKIIGGDIFDIRRVLEKGTKIVNEKLLFDKTIQYATYPLVDEKKRIYGAISVLRDVSQIRKFEQEREEAERLTFLGNLVANFAHEIKNPLNGLSIAIQRIVREFPSKDKEYTRLTSIIKKEIQSLNKILNDFLSLARPKIKEKSTFSLKGVLKEALILVREQTHEYKVLLRENIDTDVTLQGNPENMKRAFLNILLNALDAVLLRDQKRPEITVNVTKEDNGCSVYIRDNGPGMDEEDKQRIFTPYFTTKKKGTGLGLYIAQQIIKEHGGIISIETEKNIGSTFKILFT